MSWLGLAALVWDPAAPAAAPKWAALFAASLLFAGAPRRLSPAAACFLAFCAWMIWRSPDFVGWLAAAALLLGALTLPPEKLRELAGRSAALVGGGASLWALLQAGAPFPAFPHGGQGNPDWLGLVVAVALPLSVEWARRDRRRFLVVALELCGLAIARSRTAWLAAAGSLLFVTPWLALPLGLAVIVALTQPALAGRLWIWRHSARVVLSHPFLGAGDFSSAFSAVQGETLRSLPLGEACRRFVYTPSAHNDYLQVAAEAGLPALALLIAALILTARSHRPWRAGLATLVTLALAALGDRPLAQPPVVLLVALMVAAIPSPGCGILPRARMLVSATGLMLAVPSWWAAHLVTRSHDQDPPARAHSLAQAESLDPRSGPVAFEVGLGALERRDLDAAVLHLELARSRFFQPATEVALGNALLERGETARAVEVYVQLLRLQPGSLRARLNLSEALRRMGRGEDADREWRTARALWPSHVRERD